MKLPNYAEHSYLYQLVDGPVDIHVYLVLFVAPSVITIFPKATFLDPPCPLALVVLVIMLISHISLYFSC